MNIYTTDDRNSKQLEDLTKDEISTTGVIFKGKFISNELINLIKSKY